MRTPDLRISLTAFAALLLASSVTAQATQVLHRTPEQMGHTSSLVVRGEVEAVRSFWNADQTRILTETSIAVREQYKGRAAGEVRILQIGGVVGDVRMTVAGALSWAAGEDVLLFLEPSIDGRHRVAGFNQGKFHVRRDPRTGVEYVSQAPREDTRFVGAPAAAFEGGRVPLEDFLRTVGPFLTEEE